jgi:hypothetical protein
VSSTNSLTPRPTLRVDEQQIAEILDTPELGVDVEVTHRRSTTPAAATDE